MWVGLFGRRLLQPRGVLQLHVSLLLELPLLRTAESEPASERRSGHTYSIPLVFVT